MPSNMIKGQTIIDASKKKGKKIVDTQTASQALRAIKKKYGGIKKSRLYYHRGNGDWAIYSKSLDAKRDTGIRANPKFRKVKRSQKGDSNRKYHGGRL